MCESYFDKSQPDVGHENIQLLYMDIDNFILCVNTKDNINDLKNLVDFFNFSNFRENLALFKK